MTFQKLADQFSRFFVGTLFIFSGLIKLNDPIGTEIKMEEYFDVFAQDFGSVFKVFVPWSLEIGLVMIVLEIALGVAILLFYKMEITTWVLLALMVFFTFLTFYSAQFNKVTDCGCFGDAIKLTPWESFTKDVVLMVFVIHLVWYRRRYVPVLRTREGHAAVMATVFLSVFLGVYALRHLPFIDFRAYRVGNEIPRQMIASELPIIEYKFKHNNQDTTSLKYLSEEKGYSYVSSRVLNEDKIKPKITDYFVTSPDGEDITKETFTGRKLLIIMADVSKTSTNKIERLRTLINETEGIAEPLILTSSSESTVDAFRHQYQLAAPFAFADGTVLKTIIRSNPGIALWKDGIVLANWHYNDTPSAGEVKELLDR